MNNPKWTSGALVLLVVLFLGSTLMVSQGKGGGDETGRYDVVLGWPENYCGAGHVIGAHPGNVPEDPGERVQTLETRADLRAR
jgi:hypothetical protein